MPEKPFLVLLALVEAPGELLSRPELRERLWPDGTHVDFDNNLNSAVASLREILEDSARRPRYIETLPRLGYRFVAEVRRDEPDRPAGASRWLAAALGAFVILAVAGGTLLRRAAGSAPSLAVAGEAVPTRVPAAPDDSAARRAWFRGLYLADRNDRESLERALESFGEAARLAPAFAPAHGRRADTLSRLAFMPGHEMETDLARARSAALAALALDDSLAAPHRVLAVAAFHLAWDYAEARRELARALELDPLDGHSHLAAAVFSSAAGRHDEAIAEARRAVELDPSSNLVRADLGWFYLAAGRYEDSVRACREALDLDPGFRPALGFLVQANEKLGRLAEAAGAAREILRLGGADGEPGAAAPSGRPEAVLAAYHQWNLDRARRAYAADRKAAIWLALAHAELGHRGEALRYLEEAFDARDGWLVFAAGYPQLRGLHGDPQFDALLRRLGVPRADTAEAARAATPQRPAAQL